MADTKLTGLTSLASVAAGDILYAVDDPGGSPISKKLDVDVLDTYFSATTKTLTNKTIDGNNNTISNLVIGSEVTGASTALTDTADITYNADFTNLAQVLAFDTTDYATAAQGATADSAIQPGDNVTQLDGTADRFIYVSSTGDVTEIALGASGTYLESQGATSVPTWSTPSGSGDVSKVGTPVNDQIGVWTGDGTIEGTSGLTKTSTQFTAGNYTFNTDQTVGAGQDNYVLTYDDASGEIGLEASAGGGGGDAWSDPVDADIVPDGDGTRDLGATATRFAETYTDKLNVTGSIFLTEKADADADVAGDGQLWVNTATPNELYFTDDAGTDFKLSNSEVTGTSGQIYVFDGTPELAAVTMSGDATIAAGGALTVNAASLTVAGKIEIATVAETNTGTDATRAVSPDGLDGWTGSAQVTTLGTIDTGTWASAITGSASHADTMSGYVIQDYAVENASLPATTGTITLDYTNGPDFSGQLTGNSTIAFSNWPPSGTLGKVTLGIQNGSSAYTLDITTNVDNWPGGTVPTFTASINAYDEFVFWTRDGGTTVYGAAVGQDMS